MVPMFLPISLTLAGGLALINLWLNVRVSQVRAREKVWVGDGGNDAVIRRTRAHANLVENAVFVVALVVLIELATGSSVWLWGAATLFLIARILHPIGMDGWMPGRQIGAIASMLLLLVLGIWALAIPLTHRGTPTSVVLPIAEPRG